MLENIICSFSTCKMKRALKMRNQLLNDLNACIKKRLYYFSSNLIWLPFRIIYCAVFIAVLLWYCSTALLSQEFFWGIFEYFLHNKIDVELNMRSIWDMNPTFTVPTLCLHCTCTIISLNTKAFRHQLYLYLYPSQTIVQCAQELGL